MKDWFGSLGSRIFLAFALLLSISLAITYFNVTKEVERFHLAHTEESLTQKARMLRPLVRLLLEEGRDPQPWASAMGKPSGVRITIILPGGRVTADSEHNPGTMENHWTRPEIQEALKKGLGMSQRYSTTLGRWLLYAAVPVKDEKGSLLGVLRVAYPLAPVKEALHPLFRRLLLENLLLVLLALSLALLFSRYVSSRLKTLAASTQAMAQGDFHIRVPETSVQELRTLARSLNAMAASLQELFQAREEERQKMKLLLSSMPDLVVVTDREGNLLFANQAFLRLFGKEAKLWQAVRTPLLAGLFNRVWKEKKAKEEVTTHHGTFEVTAIEMVPGKEVLFIFHDVEERKRLEKMKTDFVANVSHELKTPLTVVKGYLETLEMAQTKEEREAFVEKMEKHIQRLISLVSDLLLLSSLEEGEELYSRTPLDLDPIVEKVAHWAEEEARKKGLAFQLNRKGDSRPVTGSPYLIEQLLVNLLDNAIKYTPTGKVNLQVVYEKDRAVITVEDTGIGIPKEKQDRVFERFYRVDPSRSRESGGTGLGLSIVKHIVRFHQGEIILESQEGEGTSVTVSIPLEKQG